MVDKSCRECGTPLEENKFGHNDCPKCNSENFFLMPSKKSKKREKENEDISVEKMPTEEETLAIN